jgi:hypothetical protein
MDLGKLLGALDGDEIKDALELVRKNRGLLEQLGRLPELFASFADGLDSAADQARAAGLALVGQEGDEGVRGKLLQVSESMADLAGSLGKGVGLIGDAADGIGKVPLMDSPAKRLSGAADELGSATGNVKDLAASMDTIADALAAVGTALNKLGDHLAESGGEARAFLNRDSLHS